MSDNDKKQKAPTVKATDGKKDIKTMPEGGRAEMDFASGNSRILSDKSGGRVSGEIGRAHV